MTCGLVYLRLKPIWYLTMCMSKGELQLAYLLHCLQGDVQYLQLAADPSTAISQKDPDRWSQFWVSRSLCWPTVNLFAHKEVLMLAPRHETSRANDRLEMLVCQNGIATLKSWVGGSLTWTLHWRRCIWVGWSWTRCIPTKVPSYPPLVLPWENFETTIMCLMMCLRHIAQTGFVQ